MELISNLYMLKKWMFLKTREKGESLTHNFFFLEDVIFSVRYL